MVAGIVSGYNCTFCKPSYPHCNSPLSDVCNSVFPLKLFYYEETTEKQCVDNVQLRQENTALQKDLLKTQVTVLSIGTINPPRSNTYPMFVCVVSTH